MPTQLFQQLPWVGGLNTSLDESIIPPNQLTVANNVVFATSGSRKKRDGIDLNYDEIHITDVSVANPSIITAAKHGLTTNDVININDTTITPSINGDQTVTVIDSDTFSIPVHVTAITTATGNFVTNNTKSVIGLHDYWFGTSSRTHRLVSVMSDGTVYSYNNGVRSKLTVNGASWSGTLTTCSMLTYGNILIIAVDGSSNVMKHWNGDLATPLQDVYNNYQNNCLTRASSTTTRTLVFKETFGGANGSTVIIANSGDARYNGTFTVTSLSTTTVSNDTITYTGTDSFTESTATETALYAGSNQVPKATILREYYGRILCNDKSSVDLLHYSPTSDYTLWYGAGDSGGMPVGSGDGDSVGINAIFPMFKGSLFIAKLTKLYRLDGTTPETITVQKVSDGIGCVSNNSIVPVDQDDVYFVSQRGIHSLAATQQFGDFGATYVSIDIQKTFNDSFNKSRLKYVWGAYVSNLNSIAFTFSSTGATKNDSLYLYNIPIKAWYSWPGLSCQSLISADDDDRKRFYIGTNTGRISKTLNNTNYDISPSNINTAVAYRITTGIIYPDGNPYTVKGFKRFILLFKPQNAYTISTSVKIDNIPVSQENSLSFSDVNGVDLVGSTFITGISVVGYEVPLAPYIKTVDGYGRGCKIDITQNGTDETAEIQGFMIEYEDAGVSYISQII